MNDEEIEEIETQIKDEGEGGDEDSGGDFYAQNDPKLGDK
jgi:hypothetical protein